ncbi:MAG TPA: IS66 family transposase, partial [Acidothermaceae bacterium]
TREVLALKGQTPEAMQLRLAVLEQQLQRAQKAIFGASSEKRPHDGADNEGDKPSPEKKPRKGHGPTKQPELLNIDVTHALDKADQVCTQCGGALEEWDGQCEEHEEVDVVARRFIIKRHKRKKYRCSCGACVETAIGPEKLTEGGRYSVDFAIEVATQKYCDHAPLERQVRSMKRDGLDVTSQTLWDQINALARILSPALPRVLSHVLGYGVIGVDETRWKLLGDKSCGGGSKTWQVWAVSTPTAAYYQIEDSRSGDAAEKILGGYTGTVMCDGYGVYAALLKRPACKDLRLAHCMAHVRRAFCEVEAFFPEQCGQVLELIGQLYAIDAECPAGPAGDDTRRRLRDTKSRDVVGRMMAWVYATVPTILPESGLMKAIKYMAGVWTGLVRFLDEPRIPLDNNACERALRGPVVGRKNHYGSRSQRGTEVAALFYTLVESAKLNDLDPRLYLRIAARAGLRGETIPLPHEVARPPENDRVRRERVDNETERLVAAAILANPRKDDEDARRDV